MGLEGGVQGGFMEGCSGKMERRRVLGGEKGCDECLWGHRNKTGVQGD